MEEDAGSAIRENHHHDSLYSLLAQPGMPHARAHTHTHTHTHTRTHTHAHTNHHHGSLYSLLAQPGMPRARARALSLSHTFFARSQCALIHAPARLSRPPPFPTLHLAGLLPSCTMFYVARALTTVALVTGSTCNAPPRQRTPAASARQSCAP